MAITQATRAEAIEQLIVGFEQSGMTRQRYCDLSGIPVSTFDYYRRRRQEQRSKNSGQQQLVRVEVSRPDQQDSQSGSFALTLAKGRRIESTWNFGEQDLVRLIRIVEAA
jgi:hypothetical protein